MMLLLGEVTAELVIVGVVIVPWNTLARVDPRMYLELASAVGHLAA